MMSDTVLNDGHYLGQRYATARGRIERYFDKTALQAWVQLTSDTPVGRIRTTVRQGRDRMRATLLAWIPDDLRGCRVLDAGCGSGALSVEAAKRKAQVIAVDISGSLVEIAQKRAPVDLDPAISFNVGDMLDPALGVVDYAVAMDSLIHYDARDVAGALARLAPRVRRSIVFTVAPRTPALTVMHAIGRLFPRGNRAPSIVPVTLSGLAREMEKHPALSGFRISRTERITSGFYMSQAVELVRA
jgi:magnesium-protoporphyrin O-methyltransferase